MAGRVQLALNVDDLAESVAFYTKLFGTEPAKVRPGYANFAIAEPPLKLVLLLAEAGLAAVDERDTTCCYARQDKFWVTGAPDRERWEIYTVLQDSATFWGDGGQQSWDAAQAQLDGGQSCGAPRDASAAGTASADVCCG